MISKPVWRLPVRFRRGVALAGGAALLLLLLWLAPLLIAASGAVNAMIPWLLGDAFTGQVHIGRLHLGWLRPVQCDALRVLDDGGRPVLEVASIRGERTLWQLLTSRDDLGHWVIERPVVQVTLEGETSNLERLLGTMQREPAPSNAAAPLPAASIQLVDGTLLMLDSATGQTLQLQTLQGELRAGGGAPAALAARLAARIPPAEQASPPGEIRLDARFPESAASERDSATPPDRAANEPPPQSIVRDSEPLGQLDLQCRHVDLAMLEPLLKRLGLEMQVRGALSGEASLRAAPDGRWMRLQITAFDGQRISVHWPATLGSEPIRLPRIRGKGGLEFDGRRLQLENVRLDADVASLQGDGTLSLDAFSAKSETTGHLEALAAQTGHAIVRLDLAKAAAVMPGLLRIRDDTRIEAGQVELEFASRREDGQPHWDVRLASSELVAVRAGRRLHWPQPIQLRLAARRSPAGLVVDQLHCDSHFLQVAGNGSLAGASFSAQADLNRLKSALDQFFDLPDLVLAGQLQAEARWQTREAERFRLEGKVHAESVRLAFGEQDAWTEPRLDVSLEAGGAWDGRSRPRNLEMFRVVVNAAGDRAGIELAGPVDMAQTNLDQVEAVCKIGLEGKLESWMSRLRPFIGSQGVDLTGNVRGQWTVSRQGGATHGEGSAELTEVAVFRESPTAATRGPRQPVWTEPRLEIQGRASLETASEPQVVLHHLQVVGPQAGLACRMAGTVSDFSRRVLVDLQGDLDYDLAIAVHRLRDLLGPQLQVTGRERRRFSIQGPLRPSPEELAALREDAVDTASEQPVPLVSSDLQGEAALGWQSVNYLGVAVGPGQVSSRLRDGVLSIEPLELEVSRGRLHLEPHVRLNANPPLLVLKPGPLITQMQIAPEMFRGWMRYVAPLLADATRAEGEFSLALEQGAVPLGLPEQSTVAGSMTIHSARVGPGPLAQQLLTVVDQLQAIIRQRPAPSGFRGTAEWVTLPNQSVDIRLVEGRVHHRRLQLMVDEVAIWTEGSVGLDETIALEAQIPVQDAWVDRQPWLESLRGKAVRLPIRGTLSRPRVDSDALRDFGRRAVREAAGKLLEKELGRGLQQLFGPRPAEPPAEAP